MLFNLGLTIRHSSIRNSTTVKYVCFNLYLPWGYESLLLERNLPEIELFYNESVVRLKTESVNKLFNISLSFHLNTVQLMSHSIGSLTIKSMILTLKANVDRINTQNMITRFWKIYKYTEQIRYII